MSKTKFLSRFKRNQRASIWLWTVVLAALVIYSIAWFSLGWGLMEVIDAVEANYTFQAPLSSTVEIIKTVLEYHPVLVLFGLLIYGYVNSQRRDHRENGF